MLADDIPSRVHIAAKELPVLIPGVGRVDPDDEEPKLVVFDNIRGPRRKKTWGTIKALEAQNLIILALPGEKLPGRADPVAEAEAALKTLLEERKGLEDQGEALKASIEVAEGKVAQLKAAEEADEEAIKAAEEALATETAKTEDLVAKLEESEAAIVKAQEAVEAAKEAKAKAEEEAKAAEEAKAKEEAEKAEKAAAEAGGDEDAKPDDEGAKPDGNDSEPKKDNLQALKGVGKVTEEEFNKLGLFTFKDVADATVEKLSEAHGVAAKEAASLIEQAKAKVSNAGLF